MVTVGSQEEALQALQIARGLRDPRSDEVQAPGWARIGQGTSRIALRGPGGTVYKAPVKLDAYWEEGIRSNQREAASFRS
jgi:hypothetical protein